MTVVDTLVATDVKHVMVLLASHWQIMTVVDMLVATYGKFVMVFLANQWQENDYCCHFQLFIASIATHINFGMVLATHSQESDKKIIVHHSLIYVWRNICVQEN